MVNKTDLAEAVGADLGVMERDARRMRLVIFFHFLSSYNLCFFTGNVAGASEGEERGRDGMLDTFFGVSFDR